MSSKNSKPSKDEVIYGAEQDLLPLGKKGCSNCMGKGCSSCGGTGHAIVENATANDTYQKTLKKLRGNKYYNGKK